MTAPLPWVVGQWVRGPRFYGRAALLAELEATGDGVRWVAGCRRVGKTSLLRELERRTFAAAEPMVALVLDLQGVESTVDLDLAVADAVLDLEPAAAARLGGLDGLERGDAARRLAGLGELATTRGVRLLVLIDEPETLAAVAAVDPAAVEALGGALTGGRGVTTVVASSPRLERLARRDPGLAWLAPALEAPCWIGPLVLEEAADLVAQRNLEPEQRPSLPAGAAEVVLALAGGHPYLLQLLTKRVVEEGDPAAAERTILSDPAVRSLVEVDLRLLPELDRATVSAVVLGESVTASGDRIGMLVALGLLGRNVDGRLVPGNAAVARWG